LLLFHCQLIVAIVPTEKPEMLLSKMLLAIPGHQHRLIFKLNYVFFPLLLLLAWINCCLFAAS